MSFTINSWDGNLEEKLREVVVGNRVVETDLEEGTAKLSNGTVLRFEKDTFDCCSSLTLAGVFATGESIITDLKVQDTDSGSLSYQASIFVITQSGPGVLAVAVGDASNGYYLHGWALSVTVELPGDAGKTEFWKELGIE